MLLSHLKSLCIISATLITASPLPTVVPQSTSLPSALQQAVPSCAQTCVQAALAEKFPVACSGQDGIQCLCSRYSNGGESLGEVALGCVYSGCSMVDQGAASAYNICLGQYGAVMPTKSVLTVVASSPPRTTASPISKSTATPITTTTLQTRVTSTQPVIIDSRPTTPSTTPSATSTSMAVPADTDRAPRMTPAQIAGLSVAAVAAFVIAVGLMALSVCLRRKRERKSTFDSDEKGLGTKPNTFSSPFSHFITYRPVSEASRQYPMALPPAARKQGKHGKTNVTRGKQHGAVLKPSRAVQRNGVGTAANLSDSSLPRSQIGIAISAELDGSSATPRATTKQSAQAQLVKSRPEVPPRPDVPPRPASSMTQITVFEEDETTTRRRSSVLLPTPLVPVPLICNLQPLQRAATLDTVTGFSTPPSKHIHRPSRRSELSLNIPARQERPRPKRILAAHMPSTGSPRQFSLPRSNQLAPPVLVAASASPQGTPGSSNTVDIDDYYFSSHKHTSPKLNPVYVPRIRDSPEGVLIRAKRSGSTASRTTSRASTNIRDSVSSQTSFETADPSDPTPDDEDDDKQWSDDNRLSPVAESPISKLRYPKIPRASNQLVPRSPHSPLKAHSLNSPRHCPTHHQNQLGPPSTTHLLQNRRKDLAPLLLETRVPLKLNMPKDIAMVPRPALKDPFTPPPRVRAHIRSNSTESWSTTQRSKMDRKSRTQSGMWPASSRMYEEPEAIRPLNIRRKDNQPPSVQRNRDEMQEINVGRDVDHDAEGLRSPVWIPKLTPSRKGEDLFLSVGWGGR